MAAIAPSSSTDSTSTPSTNGQTFINRVASIPVVSETLNTAHETLSKNSYTSGPYAQAGNLANSAYKTVEPTIQRFSPQLQTVDTYANKGLDAVQSRVPGLFEVKTDDVVKTARAPADHAYAVGKTYSDAAQARLAPITEHFQSHLQNVQKTLTDLQARLSQTLKSGQENVPRSPGEAAGRAQSAVQGITDSILKELDNLSNYLQTQRKELPQQAQASVQPIVDRFASGYSKIREEITKSDVPVAQKGKNILSYTQETVTPLIGEALDAVRGILGGKKDQAKDGVDSASKTANETADKASKTASDAADKASKTANETAEKAQATVNGS